MNRIRRYYFPIIVAAVLVLVLITALILTQSSSPSTTSSSDTPQAVTNSVALIVLDGWSYKVLSGGSISATTESASTGIALKALNEADLNTLLKTDPSMVQSIIARMVTANPGVTCDTTSCKAGSTVITMKELANPQDIPGYGTIYGAAGITSTAYAAAVPITAATTKITLSTSDQGNLDLPIPVSGNEQGGSTTATKAQFLVGAGMGRLFNLSPSWLSTVTVPQTNLVPTPLKETDTASSYVTAVSFDSGLSGANVDTTLLTDAQLTLWTSPTTGCQVGVLCLPESVTPSVKVNSTSSAQVCDAKGNTFMLITRDEEVKATLPYAISQIGIWNGKTPPTANALSLWYPAPQPLTSRDLDIRNQLVQVLSTGGTLVLQAGNSYQVGVDQMPTTAWDVTAGLALLQTAYHTC